MKAGDDYQEAKGTFTILLLFTASDNTPAGYNGMVRSICLRCRGTSKMFAESNRRRYPIIKMLENGVVMWFEVEHCLTERHVGSGPKYVAKNGVTPRAVQIPTGRDAQVHEPGGKAKPANPESAAVGFLPCSGLFDWALLAPPFGYDKIARRG